MLGAIIGDVVGSRFEFNNNKSKEFELITKESTFTDDTVLTVALMDWILHSKEKNKQTAAEYLLKWTQKYPYAGFGGRYYNWAKNAARGRFEPYYSYGNGSAMRISPVAWAYGTDTDQEMDMVYEATACTHNHPEGMKGAETVSHCIAMALVGWDKNEIRKYALSEYPEIKDLDYEDLRKNYKFNETCQKSVPQAIYCFLISNSFEECLRTTISIGGDCDTTAAMSCAIAEAYYDDVPEDLVKKVKEKLTPEMLKVIDEFSAKYDSNRCI